MAPTNRMLVHIGMAPCAEPAGKGESKRKTQLQPPTPPGPVQIDQLFGKCICSSTFDRMNVAAVFAPKKVYGCSGSHAFNCDPKFQSVAATRTRLTDAGRLHGVPPSLGARRLSRPNRSNEKCSLHRALSARHTASQRSTIVPKRRYIATILCKTIV